MRTLRALTSAFILIAAGACSQETTEPTGNETEPPVLSSVEGERTPMGEAVVIEFAISHEEPDGLEIWASSDDVDLIPDHQLTISGSGSNRLLTALPSPTGIGAAEITLGARSEGGSSDERAFLLEVLPPYIQRQTTSTRPEGSDADYESGIAISEHFAFVGAWQSREVHVLEREGANWQYSATLKPADPETDVSQFGRHIDVDGNFAIVSALSDDEVAAGGGAAYVFGYDGSEWSQVAKLLPPDDASSGLGSDVAISGDHAIVGASSDDGDGGTGQGAAYVFQRVGVDWLPMAKLTAPSPRDYDQFGRAVDIDGSLAVVTIPWSLAVGRLHGVAHVFEGRGSDWTEIAALTPIEPNSEDGFGRAVSLSEGTVIVGANHPNSRGLSPDAGSAYVFERTADNYSRVTKLAPSDSEPDDKFGTSVAIHGDFLLVTATGQDEPSAYVFKRVGGEWMETTKLTTDDEHLRSDFDEVVALSRDHLAILAQDGTADPSSAEPLLIHVR